MKTLYLPPAIYFAKIFILVTLSFPWWRYLQFPIDFFAASKHEIYIHDITYVKRQLRAYLTVHLCCVKRGVTAAAAVAASTVADAPWALFLWLRVRRRANCSLVNSERRRLERTCHKKPTLVGGQITPVRVARQRRLVIDEFVTEHQQFGKTTAIAGIKLDERERDLEH